MDEKAARLSGPPFFGVPEGGVVGVPTGSLVWGVYFSGPLDDIDPDGADFRWLNEDIEVP